MLRHDNVADDHETAAQPSLFKHRKETVAAARRAKKWETPIARTRDKVQVMRAIVAVQAARHNKLSVPAASQPTLAKSARMGHPLSVMGKEEHQDRERLGHPPVNVVSSSENALRPAVKAMLGEGEVAAQGAGHAEVTGVNAAKQMGLTPTGVAASRGICPSCAQFLQDLGVAALSLFK